MFGAQDPLADGQQRDECLAVLGPGEIAEAQRAPLTAILPDPRSLAQGQERGSKFCVDVNFLGLRAFY